MYAKFPGNTCLLSTFLTGGKWDFQVAKLLLLISNPALGDLQCNQLHFTNFSFMLHEDLGLQTSST